MEEQEHFGEEFRADMLTKEKEYLVDILTESLVLNLYGRKLLHAIGNAITKEQWQDTHKDVQDHFINIMAYFNTKFYEKNNTMERINNVYEINKRLLGIIEPAGDASVGEERYFNLEETIKLTERLITDVISVARWKGHHAHTINRQGILADLFISVLKENLNQ